MLIRIITSAVALLVFFTVLFLPSGVFVGAVAVVMAIMIYECMDCAKCKKNIKIAGLVSGILLISAYLYAIASSDKILLIVATVAAVMLHCVVVVLEHGKTKYTDIFANSMLIIYIVLTMACVVFCRIEMGIASMMLIFVCSWMTDTGAYFVGSFMGKHKLIPHVSPKKTVEGAIGGLVVCMFSCFVYSAIIHSIDGVALINTDSIKYVAIGAAAAIISQMGDLVASSIKRDNNIKDFGKIFPGHGGFMDRFDSVMFVAPVIYGLLLIWK